MWYCAQNSELVNPKNALYTTPALTHLFHLFYFILYHYLSYHYCLYTVCVCVFVFYFSFFAVFNMCLAAERGPNKFRCGSTMTINLFYVLSVQLMHYATL